VGSKVISENNTILLLLFDKLDCCQESI